MKKIAAVAVIAFFVTLAVIIGKRMSTDAMAVVIGVVCGVLASIPASLLILAVSRRGGGQHDQQRPASYSPVPPVVVVQGGQPQRMDVPRLGVPPGQWQNTPRSFEIVGEDNEEEW